MLFVVARTTYEGPAFPNSSNCPIPMEWCRSADYNLKINDLLWKERGKNILGGCNIGFGYEIYHMLFVVARTTYQGPAIPNSSNHPISMECCRTGYFSLKINDLLWKHRGKIY